MSRPKTSELESSNAEWFLQDTHWLEDYASLGYKGIAKLLRCSEPDARNALHRLLDHHRERTDAELRALRELNPYWSATLLGKAMGRSRGTIFKWNRTWLKLPSGRRIKGFWPVWRDYVANHTEEFLEISRRVVIRPQMVKGDTDCGECSFKDNCKSTEVLACENLTLWDCIGRRVEDDLERRV